MPDAQTIAAAIPAAQGLVRDYAALAGPAEVAIGLAVAYLGFDRFRYRKRVSQLAQSLSTELAKPKHVLKASLVDGRITSDEKSLMTLFWFTEDESFRTELKEHVPTLKKNTFWNGLCFLLLRGLLNLRLDRRAVQFTLFLLCSWQLHLAWVLYAGDKPSWVMAQPWFGVSYFTLVALAYIVPAVSFGLSEGMMAMIHQAAAGWRDSMLEQMQRNAEAANLNGPAAANADDPPLNEIVAAVADGPH